MDGGLAEISSDSVASVTWPGADDAANGQGAHAPGRYRGIGLPFDNN
jgi:hypothetical protein